MADAGGDRDAALLQFPWRGIGVASYCAQVSGNCVRAAKRGVRDIAMSLRPSGAEDQRARRGRL